MIADALCLSGFQNRVFDIIHARVKRNRQILQSCRGSTIRSFIARPNWFKNQVNGSPAFVAESDTFEPDIVAHYRHNDNGELFFAILDAKYYCFKFEPGLRLLGIPGIGDISKQFFYELALSGFIKQHMIAHFANCFLFPAESGGFVNDGYIKFDVFKNLSPIQILRLPADKMYEYYLNGVKLSADEIGILFSCPPYLEQSINL